MYNSDHFDNNGSKDVSTQNKNSASFVGHNMSSSSNNARSPQSENTSKTSTTAALRRWRRPESQDNNSKNVAARDQANDGENCVKTPTQNSNQNKEMNSNSGYVNNTENTNGSAGQNGYSMFVPPTQLSPIVPQSTARPYDTNNYSPRVPPETGAYRRTSPLTQNKLTPDVKTSDTTIVRHSSNDTIQNPYYHQDGNIQQVHYRNPNYPVQNTPPLASASNQNNSMYAVSNQNYQNFPSKSPQEHIVNREHYSYSAGNDSSRASSSAATEDSNIAASKTNGYGRIVSQGYHIQNAVDRRVTPPNSKSPTYRNYTVQSNSIMDTRINVPAQSYVTPAGRVQAAEYLAQNYYLNKSSCIVQDTRVQNQMLSSENHSIDSRYPNAYNHNYMLSNTGVITNQDPKHYRNVINTTKKHTPPFPILEQRLNPTDGYPSDYPQSNTHSKYGQLMLPKSSPTSRISRETSLATHPNYMSHTIQKTPQEIMIQSNYALQSKYFQQNPSQNWRLMKEYESNAHLNQMNLMHARLPHSSSNRTPEMPRELSYIEQNQRVIQKPRTYYQENGNLEYLHNGAKAPVQKSPKVISYNIAEQRTAEHIQNDYLNLTKSSNTVMRTAEYSRNNVIQTQNSSEVPYMVPYRNDTPNDQQSYQIMQNSRHQSYTINYASRPNIKMNDVPPRNISPRRTFQENMPYFVISPPHSAISNASSSAYNSEHPQLNYPAYYSRDPNYQNSAIKSSISQYPVDPSKYQNIPFGRSIQQARYPYACPDQNYPGRSLELSHYPGNMYRAQHTSEIQESTQNRNYDPEFRNEATSNGSFNFDRNRRKEEIGKSLKEFLESWEDDEDIVSNLPDVVLCNNLPSDRQKNNSVSSSESSEASGAETSNSTSETVKQEDKSKDPELYILDARDISSETVSQYLPYCQVYQSLPGNIRGFYPNALAGEEMSGNSELESSEPQTDVNSPSPHDLSVNRQKSEDEVLNLSTNRIKENEEFLTEEYSNTSEDVSVDTDITRNDNYQNNLEGNVIVENTPTPSQNNDEIENETETTNQAETVIEKPVTASVIVQNTFVSNKNIEINEKLNSNQNDKIETVSNEPIASTSSASEQHGSPLPEIKEQLVESLESEESLRLDSVIESEINLEKNEILENQFDFDTALLSTDTKDSTESKENECDVITVPVDTEKSEEIENKIEIKESEKTETNKNNEPPLIRENNIDLTLETMLLSPEPIKTPQEEPEIPSEDEIEICSTNMVDNIQENSEKNYVNINTIPTEITEIRSSIIVQDITEKLEPVNVVDKEEITINENKKEENSLKDNIIVSSINDNLEDKIENELLENLNDKTEAHKEYELSETNSNQINEINSETFYNDINTDENNELYSNQTNEEVTDIVEHINEMENTNTSISNDLEEEKQEISENIVNKSSETSEDEQNYNPASPENSLDILETIEKTETNNDNSNNIGEITEVSNNLQTNESSDNAIKTSNNINEMNLTEIKEVKNLNEISDAFEIKPPSPKNIENVKDNIIDPTESNEESIVDNEYLVNNDSYSSETVIDDNIIQESSPENDNISIKNENFEIFDEDTLPRTNDLTQTEEKIETCLISEKEIDKREYANNENTEIVPQVTENSIEIEMKTAEEVVTENALDEKQIIENNEISSEINEINTSSDQDEYQHLITLDDASDDGTNDNNSDDKQEEVNVDETNKVELQLTENTNDLNDNPLISALKVVEEIDVSTEAQIDNKEETDKDIILEVGKDISITNNIEENIITEVNTEKEEILEETMTENKEKVELPPISEETESTSEITVTSCENIILAEDTSNVIVDNLETPTENILVAEESNCVVVYSDDENILILQSDSTINEIIESEVVIEEKSVEETTSIEEETHEKVVNLHEQEVSTITVQEEIREETDQDIITAPIEEELNQEVITEIIEEEANKEVITETIEEEANKKVITETIEEEANKKIITETIEKEANHEVITETIVEEANQEVITEIIEEETNQEVITETIEEEANQEVITETIEEEANQEVITETIEEEANQEVITETIEANQEVITETIEEEANQEIITKTIEKEENKDVITETIKEEIIGNELIICENGIEHDWVQNEEIVETKIEDNALKEIHAAKKRRKLKKLRKAKLLSIIEATNKFLEEERKVYEVAEISLNEENISSSLEELNKIDNVENKELFINPENPLSLENNNNISTFNLLNILPRGKRCISWSDTSTPKIDFIAPKRRYSNLDFIRNNYKKPIINLDEISNNITKVLQNFEKQESLQIQNFEKSKTLNGVKNGKILNVEIQNNINEINNSDVNKSNEVDVNKSNDKEINKIHKNASEHSDIEKQEPNLDKIENARTISECSEDIVRSCDDGCSDDINFENNLENRRLLSIMNLDKSRTESSYVLNSKLQSLINLEKSTNILQDQIFAAENFNSIKNKSVLHKVNCENCLKNVDNSNDSSDEGTIIEIPDDTSPNSPPNLSSTTNQKVESPIIIDLEESNVDDNLMSFQSYTETLKSKIKQEIQNTHNGPLISSSQHNNNQIPANHKLPQRKIDPRIDRRKEISNSINKPMSLIQNKIPKTFGLTEYTKSFLKMKTGQNIDSANLLNNNGVRRLDPRLSIRPDEPVINVETTINNNKTTFNNNNNLKVNNEKKVKINLQDYRNRKQSLTESEKSNQSADNSIKPLTETNTANTPINLENISKEVENNLSKEAEPIANEIITQKTCKFYIRDKLRKQVDIFPPGDIPYANIMKPKKSLQKVTKDKNKSTTPKLSTNNNEQVNNQMLKSNLDFKTQKPKRRRKRFRNLDASDEEDETPVKQQKGVEEDILNVASTSGGYKSSEDTTENSNTSSENQINSGLKCHIKLNTLDKKIRNYEINKNKSGNSNLKLTLKSKPAFSDVLSSLDTIVETEVKTNTTKRKLKNTRLKKFDSVNNKNSSTWTIRNKVPKVIIKRNASGYCAVFRDVTTNPIWQPKIRLKRQKYIESLVLGDKTNKKIGKKIAKKQP